MERKNQKTPPKILKLIIVAGYSYNNPLLILTPFEHVPTVNVGIPHCGGVDKHQR